MMVNVYAAIVKMVTVSKGRIIVAVVKGDPLSETYCMPYIDNNKFCRHKQYFCPHQFNVWEMSHFMVITYGA